MDRLHAHLQPKLQPIYEEVNGGIYMYIHTQPLVSKTTKKGYVPTNTHTPFANGRGVVAKMKSNFPSADLGDFFCSNRVVFRGEIRLISIVCRSKIELMGPLHL